MSEEVSTRRGSPLGWVIDKGAAVIGLIAIVVYGVARLAVEGFYSRLALAPEDVGLTQAVILGRAALAFSIGVTGLVVFLGFTMICVAGGVAWFRSRQARRAGRPYDSSMDVRWRLTSGALVFLLATPLLAARFLHGAFDIATESVLRLVLSYLLWTTVLATMAFWERFEKRAALRAVSDRWEARLLKDPGLSPNGPQQPYLLSRHGRPEPSGGPGSDRLPAEFGIAVVLVLGLLTSGILFVSYNYGYRRAEGVLAGRGQDPGFGPLSVRADPVCLHGVQSSTTLPPGPYMYLGRVGDTLVLYDYLRMEGGMVLGRPLRVPAAGLAIRIAEKLRVRPDGRELAFRPWACSGV